MLYLVGVGLEKKFGSMKNCGRRSHILDKMLPEIAFLTSGFGIYNKFTINKSFTIFTNSGWKKNLGLQ